jgi:hypothetical protein
MAGLHTIRLLLSLAIAAVLWALPSPSAAQDNVPPETVFQRADANGDGKLTKEEAARVPSIGARFEQLDKNKDGVLSMDEFLSAMRGVK